MEYRIIAVIGSLLRDSIHNLNQECCAIADFAAVIQRLAFKAKLAQVVGMQAVAPQPWMCVVKITGIHLVQDEDGHN